MPKSDDDATAEQFQAVASQLDRPEPPEGLPAHYVCEHGSSNRPCLCHYATAMLTGQPLPTVQPDDWHVNYVAPGAPGVSDSAQIG